VGGPQLNAAALGREYLLAGHLIDRAGMPQVLTRYGREAMRDIAIEEWMGASPVYTRRAQRALGFTGDDVATIFKGMQLDIGAPHQFMDFRYSVSGPDHGEFQLRSCGALMDVEPMGDEFVVAMCHHIEDPTFDATACATNPRARMRPVHRPPRVPTDRHPHCHWTVDIVAGADPVPEPAAAVSVAASVAARLDLGSLPAPSYAGAFDPDFQLEHLPPDALERALAETCLQGHLLVHSFLLAVDRRWGADAAREIGVQQLTGVAGVVAARLTDGSRGLGEIRRVLELHPAFLPRAYVALSVESDDDGLTVRLNPSPALDEVGGWSWPALLTATGAVRPFEAIAQAVDRRARVACTGDATWRITVDPAAEPAQELSEVTLTKFSTGAAFVFRPVA
jgi:hypothetical protein